MSDARGWYTWQDGDLLLRIQVQARATREGFAGVHGDALRVRIPAPPVDGRANARLLAFLARAFAVPRSSVELLTGQGGRRKRVLIRAPATVPAEIGALLDCDYK